MSEDMATKIGLKERRMLKSQRTKMRSIWTGFGFFGLIGWSVVVPTLLGATAGRWLDGHYPDSGRSWTLSLLIAGLLLGGSNAWRWVSKEHREIREEQEEKNDAE